MITVAWCMWAVALGWAAAIAYYWSQDETVKPAKGAWVILVLIWIIAVVISIAAANSTGAVIQNTATPTPLLGR